MIFNHEDEGDIGHALSALLWPIAAVIVSLVVMAIWGG